MARPDSSARDPLPRGWALLAFLLACGPAPVHADSASANAEASVCDPYDPKPPADQAFCPAQANPASENAALLVPRALLAIPRLLFRTATELLRLGTGIEDDYQVSRRLSALSYGQESVFSAYPMVQYDTRGGIAVGATLVRSNIFGAGEEASVLGMYGGRYRQLYQAQADTGFRFGTLQPGFSVAFEADNRGRFYGIGNGDIVPTDELSLPLNAQVEGPAVRTRFRVEEFRVQYAADRRYDRFLLARISQLWRARDVSSGESGTVWVNQVFAPSTLVGYGPALVDAYTQLAVSWDNRESLRDDTPRSLPGAGFRGVAWTGMQAELAAPHDNFGRFGVDLHSFFDLYRGNRILHLRARVASAIGPLSAIPFLDLPQLGGARLLRGYESGRFHGRLTVLGSIEYRYPVQELIAAYLFVDAGRVYGAVTQFTLRSLIESRVGFGAGVQIFTFSKALFRLQIASSIDGGIYFHIGLNTTDEPSADD